MISFWRQLRLLLWKAYLIKKRQNVWIAIEILIPVLLFAMLVIIRTRDFYVLSNECHYDAKSFPSSGVLPFMHSLLCSISNDCKNHATTADDTYQVNVRAERKTLLVDVVRWLRSFLEIIAESPDRWRDIFLQFANAIHIVAGLHANQTADNDQQMNLTFPFLTFFDSPQHMLEILHDDFGFDNETAEKFLDISVTPQFIFRAMEELVNVSSRDLSPFSIFEDNKVSFLCDKSKTSQLFSSVNDIHEEIDFCRITHSNIILSLLLNAKQYDFRDITLHFMRERSSENVKHLSINDFTTNLRFAMGEMRRLSPLNYSVFSNSKELEDAVFCGGISKMMEHDSGNKPATFYNPKLEQLRSRITQFILQTSPELSDQDKAGFCGNISTAEAFECKSLPFGMPQFKTLFRGYILVAPDSPVVREIVDKLNRPLKVFNMFRDIIYDFGDIASPLQDAIAQSDLKTAAQALLDLLPDLDKNSTLRFVLEHWFNNSTDPNSFLTQFQRMGIQMSNIAKCFRIDRFVVVKDEEELEQRAMCLTTHDQYFSGVVFLNVSENSTTLPDFVAYKIRHNPKLVDSTKGIPMDSHNILSRDNPWDDLKYLSYGFSFLQEAVERAIISEITNETIETGIQSQQEPYPCVVSDTFKVSTFLSLFVILSWMIPSSLLVKNIVWEKEMRLKEIMRIMGLGNAIHWLAWATQALSFTGISVMVISVLLKYGNILGKTDFTLILVLLSLFAMACLLLPQTSIGFGMNMLGYSDDIGNGTWAGLNSITLFDIGIPEITLKKVFIALSMDCIIYLVLAWYISAVFPGTFGIPKPWYFFFNVPYKLLCKRPGNWTPIRCFWMPSAEALSETCPENGAPNFLSPNPEPTASFEPTQADMIHAIKIRNLTKIYGNNTKALDSLSVDFFESQITAFLGHNGAGKTTTISILTGLYPPTLGTANVYDLDIRTDIRKIRDFLGFCPQHNILFDRMTVEEQLEFYASLKGVESSRMREEVDSMITDIGLENKRTALANTLSGGMKRKLCIGIALIGGSKLIILDEPTAGIDAYARRSIWQLLLKHKHGRTMILSTHHMDEADVLADRIAIIAEGRLKAAGSSLFLKKRFGNGYQLTIAKETSSVIAKDEEKPAILAIADSQGATITAYIEQFCGLGQAQLIEEVEFESIYKLPLEMKSEQLAALFEGLESAKDLLGITSYGLSAPSLQQIFLNIAPVHDLKLKKDSSQNSFVSFLSNSFRRCRRNHTVSNKTDLIMAGLVQDGSNTKIPDDDPAPDPLMEHPMIKFITNRRQMHFHHAKAMFYKRLHISNRSWISLFAELILPLCLLISAEIYIKIQRPPSPITTGQPELALVPLIYGNDTNFYFGIWEKSSLNGTSHGRKYLEDMIEPPGLGTRCVDTNWAFNSTKFRCQNDTTSGPPTLSHSHKHIPYNEPQVCGCLPKSGWNCTFEDYPNEKLQRIPLKSTDVLWDLTYRNISQYRLVTSDNTTSWPIRPGTYFLGGWTFGHENAQYPAAERLNLTDLGVEDMIFIAENMSEIIRLDWRVPATQANWTHKYDPFNPQNMTVLDLFKEIFDNLDTKEITKIWFNNKLWASLPINTNAYHNAVLRTLLPSSKRKHVGILAINHPMNETVTQSLQSGKLRPFEWLWWCWLCV
ncbi:ABC transporter domain-containing protein [Ditylenchus destructor]|nr:ABC transporter domain-containing protein [Ditylenchus destructor]